MMIQLDLDLIPEAWREDQFKIIADYWEDNEMWVDIEVIDPELKTWISHTMPDCIVD
jgi:hypothetical protein